jgi:hypothetical protein
MTKVALGGVSPETLAGIPRRVAPASTEATSPSMANLRRIVNIPLNRSAVLSELLAVGREQSFKWRNSVRRCAATRGPRRCVPLLTDRAAPAIRGASRRADPPPPVAVLHRNEAGSRYRGGTSEIRDMAAPLRLTNTLTRRKEEFRPIDPDHVRMYVCGPTGLRLRPYRQRAADHRPSTCCSACCATSTARRTSPMSATSRTWTTRSMRARPSAASPSAS